MQIGLGIEAEWLWKEKCVDRSSPILFNATQPHSLDWFERIRYLQYKRNKCESIYNGVFSGIVYYNNREYYAPNYSIKMEGGTWTQPARSQHSEVVSVKTYTLDSSTAQFNTHWVQCYWMLFHWLWTLWLQYLFIVLLYFVISITWRKITTKKSKA